MTKILPLLPPPLFPNVPHSRQYRHFFPSFWRYEFYSTINHLTVSSCLPSPGFSLPRSCLFCHSVTPHADSRIPLTWVSNSHLRFPELIEISRPSQLHNLISVPLIFSLRVIDHSIDAGGYSEIFSPFSFRSIWSLISRIDLWSSSDRRGDQLAADAETAMEFLC